MKNQFKFLIKFRVRINTWICYEKCEAKKSLDNENCKARGSRYVTKILGLLKKKQTKLLREHLLYKRGMPRPTSTPRF